MTVGDGVTIMIAEGSVSSITGLATGKAVTYDGTTYTNPGNLMVHDSKVYGVSDVTNVLDLENETNGALFRIDGVSAADDLTYADNTVTVAQGAFTAQPANKKQSISVHDITGTATLAIDAGYTKPTTGAWSLSGGSKIASFNRADYYEYDEGTNTIVYHPQASNTEVEITFDGAVTQAMVNALTVGNDKIITVAKYDDNNDGTADKVIPHGFEITSGTGYTIVDPTGIATVALKGAATVNATAIDGTATVTGTLTEGYWRSDNNTKLNYQGEKTGVTLATITGLKTGAANTDNVVLNTTTATQVDLKAGALADTNVNIVNAKHPNGTDFTYTLGLVTTSETAADNVNTSKNAEATETVWVLSGNTATYKDVYKAYYTANSDTTIITYNAPSNKTTHGTINNLSANIAEATGTGATLAVAQDKQSIVVNYKDTNGADATVTDAIKATGSAGAYTFTIKKEAMLANGTSVTLTSRPSRSTSTLALGAGADAPAVKTADPAPEWALTGSNLKTATLTATLTEGYTLTNDTTIKTSAETANQKIVTISNLNKDLTEALWKANKVGTTENYYYTMEGQTTALPAGNDDGVNVGEAGNGYITIKLKKAALGTVTVSVTIPTSAFKYKLAIDNDATQQMKPGTSTPVEEDVWEFKSGVATFKRVVPAYYTPSGSGSNTTISYHVPVVKQTYATIKGLNSTVLAKKLEYDSTTGELSFTPEGGTKTVYLTVDGTNKKIRLNKEILAADPSSSGNNIVLTQGSGSTYTLAINDGTGTDFAQKVQGADTTAEWWTVSNGTAVLHQDIQAGYTLTNDNKTLKYTAAVENRTLATITGLSNNVKALVKDGTEVTSGNEKKAYQLGIAKIAAEGSNPEKAAVVAHTTADTYKDAPKADEVATWNTGTQDITLTAAMLDKKRVSLRDNYTANGNTDNYNLKLETADSIVKPSSGADLPSQAPVEVTEWETGTTTAKLVNYK